MSVTRREWLSAAATVAAVAPYRRLSAATSVTDLVTPEHFGALGDGRTNDTAAFVRMSDFVNRRGGGSIALRPRTYVVGLQAADPKAGYAYRPSEIMKFAGCNRPLIIKGNGARLKCADGLRYGTFDARTGQPTEHRLPYYDPSESSSPYFAMVMVEDCSGLVEIEHLELDGNVAGLQIGGPWGDTGWQIGCVGLFLRNNRGSERISRVNTHHHAQDGIQIDGLSERASSSVLEHCTSDYNARQGCSLVGGRNYVFRNCRFRNTGKARVTSAPGAGVDIEAEGDKTVRDVTFTACEFSNNAGVGLLADQGDSEGATFRSCRFIATTTWGAWPNKPGFRFFDCDFVGSIVNAHGDADPDRATQFHHCLFRDDPALSPTGEVFNAKDRHPIADLPFARNVLLDRCRIKLTHRAVLPWTAQGAIYVDCVMSQVETKVAYPRGIYRGTNRIIGKVDLYGSVIAGELIVNGLLVPLSS